MKKVLCVLVSLIGLTVPSMSQVTLTPFASGFTSPVDIKNCGDGRIFVLEQNGQINILDTAGNINPVPFLDIVGRVLYSGEQGCLGLAFPPDFATSQVFYVNYTRRPDGDTRISRFHVSATNPDSADANSEEILLTIHQPYSNHNGGHIQFGKDGYLYIGMGDGGSGGDPENRAQNPDSLLGKMLRIAVDPSNPTYSIPPTNPFAGNPSLGAEEIWALGVRNPWRWSFDRATGDLWIGDVGQGT
ncbi:MAG TPA: PQQ-dependent sugar dehydrogenase, partial [Bacteroidia bacterium]|nr:PQQ-dependent sugar dehydrogenase [Bacteroidia bacterium]